MKAHLPVLLDEVIHILSPEEGKIYIDATFGAGGYSDAILSKCNCSILAFDRDQDTLPFFSIIEQKFPGRIKFFNTRFSLMEESILASFDNNQKIDSIIFDLGVSSMQLADEKRGFSFLHDGPLDMRMSSKEDSITAATIINTFYEKKIADLLFEYGDETASRKIAKAIVNARGKYIIKSTHQLAEIVRSVFPNKYYKTDPATKTFQALRIFINSELQELEKGLDIASRIVAPGGKIIVVSFHSLEDSIVKNKFKKLKEEGKFTIINKKVISPSREEIKTNRRARSAKLRAIIKQCES